MEEAFVDAKYFELLERKLDSQQMAACVSHQNTVVAAGAGSGKTHTLSCRFAYLVLSDGIEAQKILTLTFTKKAACEMRERIYQTLEFFAQKEIYQSALPDGSRIDKNTADLLVRRARSALDVFHLTHIQTLDSYCGDVLRSGARFFGISEDFDTGDVQSGKQIQDSALPFILEHGKAISSIFTEKSIQDFANNTFAAIIENHTSLATEDGYFSNFLPKQIKAAAEGANNAIEKLKEAAKELKNAADNYTGKGKGFLLLRGALSKNMPDINISREDIAYTIKNSDGAKYDVSNKTEAVCQIEKLLDWAKNIGSITAPAGTGAIMALFRRRKNAGDNITPIDVLSSIASFISDLPRTALLLHLLDDFTQSINTKKRKTGHLTFNDVNKMAMKTLLTEREILLQENNAYSKIMIDEFQDNNGANRDLLFLLSLNKDALLGESPLPDGIYEAWQSGEDISLMLLPLLARDKLFFVGDEKQSIYRFRGADVSVFNRLKEDLCSGGGKKGNSLNMAMNYRSAPELLKSFNILFGGDGGRANYIFKPNGDKKHYEAYYTVFAQSPKGLPKLNKDNVAMHVAILRKDSQFSDGCKIRGDKQLLKDDDQKAYYIASHIAKLHSEGVKYKDIAVLDRSRTHRKELLYWMHHFKIPFVLDQRSRLFEDAVVNDVYNFLKLVSYPSDKSALASYLASPLVGLTADEVILVLAALKENKKQKTVSALPLGALNETEYKNSNECIANVLPPSSYKKYLSGMDFCQTERTASLKRPLTATLDRLWYDCGMRYEGAGTFTPQYDMLFALCCQMDASGGGIVRLTDSLAAIKKKEQNAFNSNGDSGIDLSSLEYPVEETDSVKIMTVHKSKGLEFLHVFVLGCFDMSDAAEQGDWLLDSMGVSFRPPFKDGDNYFYLLNRDRIIDEEMAESKRLLYVAATRAISSVTIAASIRITKTPLNSKADGSLMLAPFLESYSLSDGFSNPDVPSDSLLPVSYQAGSAFDVAIIPCMTQAERVTWRGTVKSPSVSSLIDTYNAARRIPKAVVGKPFILPSHLEEASLSSPLHPAPLPSLPAIYPIAPNLLGTLMHGVLERCLTGGGIDSGSMRILSDIRAEDEDVMYSTISAVETAFKQSALYSDVAKAIAKGRLLRTEWPFMMSVDGGVIKGKADLLYENDSGELVIVDYKSDKVIDPQKHKAQLMIYKKAACVLGYDESKIRCVLCYISHGMKLLAV